MSRAEKHYHGIIIPIIKKHLPRTKIILYGSRARGDYKEGADVDIALDNNIKIDNDTLLNIRDELEESQLPISFDIVDFNAVSNRMKQEILKDGVLWNESNLS